MTKSENPPGEKYVDFSFGDLTIRKFLNSQRGSAASFLLLRALRKFLRSPRGGENEVFAKIASGKQKSQLQLQEGRLS